MNILFNFMFIIRAYQLNYTIQGQCQNRNLGEMKEFCHVKNVENLEKTSY